MRLNIATSLTTFAAVPALIHGFQNTGQPVTTQTTTVAAQRPMFPILHQRDLFFPDIDGLFEDMDEMMESSLLTRFTRPSQSLLGGETPGELKLRRPLGFEVTQDEKEYKVAVHVPDVEAKDVDLQLDHDGRVLHLKGNKAYEEGGTKVQSHFEKSILLSPDVDTTKLTANMSGDTLTVVAPKIEQKAALDMAENKKIEIKVVTPKAALADKAEPLGDLEKAATLPKVENQEEEKVATETVEDDEVFTARTFRTD